MGNEQMDECRMNDWPGLWVLTQRWLRQGRDLVEGDV